MVDDQILNLINKICLVISLFFLLLTFSLVHYRHFHNQIIYILRNMATAMFVREIIFIASPYLTTNEIGWRIVALVYDFFVLSTVSWKLCIFVKLFTLADISVEKDAKQHFGKATWVYDFLGYGLPGLAVVFWAMMIGSVGINQLGFGPPRAWLPWISILPFLPALVIYVYILSNMSCCTTHEITEKVDRSKTNTVSSYKFVIIMIPLLSMGWLFGALTLIDMPDNLKIVFRYLLVIFDGLEGLFAFMLLQQRNVDDSLMEYDLI